MDEQNVIVEATEEKKPDLILEIPEAAEGIDVSEWISNTIRILGKKYNVIFIDHKESNS